MFFKKKAKSDKELSDEELVAELQRAMANFAGSTLLLLFKPYKVGDLIEVQRVQGNVKEI